MPPLLNLSYVLQPGTASHMGTTQGFGAPADSLPEHGTAMHGVSAACGAAAAAGSRANSSLCGTLSGISEMGTSGASDASLPLSGRPSPRQVRNHTTDGQEAVARVEVMQRPQSRSTRFGALSRFHDIFPCEPLHT